MNFSPFGGPFSASIPGIHQFAASGALNSSNVQDTSNRYNAASTNLVNIPHFNQSHSPHLSKFRSDGPGSGGSSVGSTSNKYNGHSSSNNVGNTMNNEYTIPSYTQSNVSTHHQSTHDDKIHRISTSNYHQSNMAHQSQMPELTQDLCNALLNQQQTSVDTKKVLQNVNTGWQSLAPSAAVADYLSQLPASTLPLSLHHFLKYSSESIKKENVDATHHQNIPQGLNLNSLGSSLLSNANILNQPQPPHTHLHQQLQQQQQPPPQQQQQHQQPQQQQPTHQIQNIQHPIHSASQQQLTANISTSANSVNTNNNPISASSNVVASTTATTNSNVATTPPTKKKKRKKPPKEKKPRPKPGEIRLTTALDGSTLFCCPECQMAYPERGLLEQHLVGHNLERRFICDICNAALKRKDHLTRHKQSHNPERPFVCTICMKAFKRKEQLTLHFVIHSGEKRHICNECGKGFYRKDHLRKHTRSHIARRVKAELSQQNPSPNLIAAQQLQSQQQQQQHNAMQ